MLVGSCQFTEIGALRTEQDESAGLDLRIQTEGLGRRVGLPCPPGRTTVDHYPRGRYLRARALRMSLDVGHEAVPSTVRRLNRGRSMGARRMPVGRRSSDGDCREVATGR